MGCQAGRMMLLSSPRSKAHLCVYVCVFVVSVLKLYAKLHFFRDSTHVQLEPETSQNMAGRKEGKRRKILK